MGTDKLGAAQFFLSLHLLKTSKFHINVFIHFKSLPTSYTLQGALLGLPVTAAKFRAAAQNLSTYDVNIAMRRKPAQHRAYSQDRHCVSWWKFTLESVERQRDSDRLVCFRFLETSDTGWVLKTGSSYTLDTSIECSSGFKQADRKMTGKSEFTKLEPWQGFVCMSVHKNTHVIWNELG